MTTKTTTSFTVIGNHLITFGFTHSHPLQETACNRHIHKSALWKAFWSGVVAMVTLPIFTHLDYVHMCAFVCATVCTDSSQGCLLSSFCWHRADVHYPTLRLQAMPDIERTTSFTQWPDFSPIDLIWLSINGISDDLLNIYEPLCRYPDITLEVLKYMITATEQNLFVVKRRRGWRR